MNGDISPHPAFKIKIPISNPFNCSPIIFLYYFIEFNSPKFATIHLVWIYGFKNLISFNLSLIFSSFLAIMHILNPYFAKF